MTGSTTQALARAASALVSDHDVTDVLARLAEDARAAMSAAAVGPLIENTAGELELLTATSHRAQEIELYQAQQGQGPCIDAVNGAQATSAQGPAEIEARWPETGPDIVAAGFHAVHAHPLRWRRSTLGALNVFYDQVLDDNTETTDARHLLGQTFADIATLVILAPEITASDIRDRTERALSGRTIVERAKGVLAYQHGGDVDVAYSRLQQLAEKQQETLTTTATRVVDDAARPPHGSPHDSPQG